MLLSLHFLTVLIIMSTTYCTTTKLFNIYISNICQQEVPFIQRHTFTCLYKKTRIQQILVHRFIACYCCLLFCHSLLLLWGFSQTLFDDTMLPVFDIRALNRERIRGLCRTLYSISVSMFSCVRSEAKKLIMKQCYVLPITDK